MNSQTRWHEDQNVTFSGMEDVHQSKLTMHYCETLL